MEKNETVTLTNMCMIYDGDKILVQDRTNAGWKGVAFPGGHVEKGESFVDSVVREVFEETGLTISSPKLCGVKNCILDGYRYVVFLYKTDSFSGTLKSSEEGEVFWINKDNLLNMNLARDMDEMYKVFCGEAEELFRLKENEEWKNILK